MHKLLPLLPHLPKSCRFQSRTGTLSSWRDGLNGLLDAGVIGFGGDRCKREGVTLSELNNRRRRNALETSARWLPTIGTCVSGNDPYLTCRNG